MKTDRIDARDAGAAARRPACCAEVWVRDERIGALRRRVARRGALVRQRTRAKNEVHAVLSRCLLGAAAGQRSVRQGRAAPGWPGTSCAEEEQETVEGCLRQIDFLDAEIARIDAQARAVRARLAAMRSG